MKDIFERSKQPLNWMFGIFFFYVLSRAFWNHDAFMIPIGIMGSTIGWFLLPPGPGKTLAWVYTVIDEGIAWWRKPVYFEKAAVLFMGTVAYVGFLYGLWIHHSDLAIISFSFVLVIKLLAIGLAIEKRQ